MVSGERNNVSGERNNVSGERNNVGLRINNYCLEAVVEAQRRKEDKTLIFLPIGINKKIPSTRNK